MTPALSLAQSAHDDESMVSVAQRIRDLGEMLLVARRDAEENAARVVRLTAGLDQVAAMAEAGLPRTEDRVPRLVVQFTLSSIHAVAQAALEES